MNHKCFDCEAPAKCFVKYVKHSWVLKHAGYQGSWYRMCMPCTRKSVKQTKHYGMFDEIWVERFGQIKAFMVYKCTEF